jgi:hypothetical protein
MTQYLPGTAIQAMQAAVMVHQAVPKQAIQAVH